MIKVMIVEDIYDYRNALSALIDKKEGFKCIAAYADAESCIREALYKEADILLIDIHLPGMNGIQLLKHIKSTQHAPLCMMCTAYDEDEKIFEALQEGAHGYLLKSTSPVQILEAVTELYNGGSPMSALVARKVVEAMQRPKMQDLPITAREKEVLSYLAKGLLYKEIAFQLGISIETVRHHCFNIYDKLHVNNRTEAINKYFGHK